MPSRTVSAEGRDASFAMPGHIVILAAAVFSVGFLFNGFNNALGPSISCLLNSALLGYILLWRVPAPEQWRRVLPMVVAVALATVWAAGGIRWLLGMDPMTLVPDLIGAGVLQNFALVAALLCGFFLGRDAAAVDRVVRWILVFGSADLLFGLYLNQSGGAVGSDIWSPTTLVNRFAGTLSNANVAAAYSGVLAVLALGQVLDAARPGAGREGNTARTWMLTFGGLVILLALTVCVVTASRAATVFTLTAMAILVIHSMQTRGAGGLRLLAPIGAAASFAVVVVGGQSGLLFHRFGELGDGIDVRLMMLSHYSDVALASPLWGYGLQSFSAVNASHLSDPATAGLLWIVNSAHNLPLQLAIEGGLPYLLALSAVSLAIAWQIARSGRAFTANESGLAMAIMTLLGCGMVDIALDVPAMASLSLAMTGLLWARCGTAVEVGVTQANAPPA